MCFGSSSEEKQETVSQNRLPAWAEGAAQEQVALGNYLTSGMIPGARQYRTQGDLYSPTIFGGVAPGLGAGPLAGGGMAGGYTDVGSDFMGSGVGGVPTGGMAGGVGPGTGDPLPPPPSTRIAGFTPTQSDVFDQIRNLEGSNITAEDLGADFFRDVAGRGPYLLGDTPTVSAAQVDPTQIGNVDNMMAAQTRNVDDVSAGRGIDYMSDYMNPYTTGVVDTALGDIERQRARQQAAAGLQNAASSAFGSRGQIRQGMIDEAALDAGARTAAQLRESGFRTAAGLGMQDVNRLLAAGQTNQAAQLQRALTDAKFQQDASQRNQAMAQQRALQQANLEQARAIEQARLQQQSGLTEADLQMRGLLADQQSRQLADRAALEAQQLAGAATLSADELERSRLMDNLDLLSQIGSLEQDLEQRRLDEPFDALQFRAALLGMTPMPNQTTGRGRVQTRSSTGGLLGDLLTAGVGAAAGAAAGG
jgi:hypothetical protein